MLLSKANLDSIRFVTTEGKYRSGMMGLYVDKDKTVATDGKQMVIVQTPKEDESEFPPVPGHDNGNAYPAKTGAIVPRDTVSVLLKNLPNGKRTREILKRARITFSEDGTHAIASTTDLEKGVVLPTQLIEEPYPDFKNAMPKGKPIFKIGVNPRMLAELLDFANRHTTEECKVVKLSFWKEDTCFRIEPLSNPDDNIPKWTAVCMPIRLRD